MTPRFNIGDRVKVRRSWSTEDGALGIVAEPPERVRLYHKYKSRYFRKETTLTGSETVIYWVKFDASDSISGTAEGGEFDESELEKL